MPKPAPPSERALDPSRHPGPAAVGKPPHAPDVPADECRGERPALPHERDESAGDTAAEPDPVIQQAARDLQQGQVDTDLRATPGLDAARRRPHEPGP